MSSVLRKNLKRLSNLNLFQITYLSVDLRKCQRLFHLDAVFLASILFGERLCFLIKRVICENFKEALKHRYTKDFALKIPPILSRNFFT